MKELIKKSVVSTVVLLSILGYSTVNAQSGKISKYNEVQRSLKTKINKNLPAMRKVGKNLTKIKIIRNLTIKNQMKTKKLSLIGLRTQKEGACQFLVAKLKLQNKAMENNKQVCVYGICWRSISIKQKSRVRSAIYI